MTNIKQLVMSLATAAAFMTFAGVTFAEDAVGRVETKIMPQTEIKGEVMKVEGDNFVVKDERSKKEVKFTIEKDVKASLERPLKQGDRIEAILTPEGFAKTVRMETADTKSGKAIGDVQAPGTLSPPAKGSKGGSKSDEGSNPTLDPANKGSASGG